MRLSPHEPMMPLYLLTLGAVNLLADRHEEAMPWLKKSLRLRPHNPPGYRLLAACYGHLDQDEEARAALGEMYRLSPDITVEAIQAFLPPAILERMLEGWRKAGWKEG